MSPRGVAISNVQERLFDAAERVLAREGPNGLTNRTITNEAGCAKGVLYTHFADLDDFAARLVLRHFQRMAEHAADLPRRAGRETVADNLADAAIALLGPNGPTLAALAVSRPAVSDRLRDAWAHGAPGFDAVERSLAAYLVAEQALGRFSADADAESLALAIVGATHHLLMTGWAGVPDPADRLRRLVVALTRSSA